MKHRQHHSKLLIVLALIVAAMIGGGVTTWYFKSQVQPQTQQTSQATLRKSASRSSTKVAKTPSSTHMASTTKTSLPAKGSTVQYVDILDNPKYSSIAKQVKISFSLSEPAGNDIDSRIDIHVDNTSGYPVMVDMNALSIDTLADTNMRTYANNTGGVIYPSDKNNSYVTTNVFSMQGDVFNPDHFPAIIRYYDHDNYKNIPIAVNYHMDDPNGGSTSTVQQDGYAMMHHFKHTIYTPELKWSPPATVQFFKSHRSMWEMANRFQVYNPGENQRIGGWTKYE